MLSLRTRIIPRWMAFLGYAPAPFTLLSMGYVEWGALVFPLWVLLISVCVLIKNYRLKPEAAMTGPPEETPNMTTCTSWPAS
jgi:hypothetical protein